MMEKPPLYSENYLLKTLWVGGENIPLKKLAN
jgi:hypothetical protein